MINIHMEEMSASSILHMKCKMLRVINCAGIITNDVLDEISVNVVASQYDVEHLYFMREEGTLLHKAKYLIKSMLNDDGYIKKSSHIIPNSYQLKFKGLWMCWNHIYDNYPLQEMVSLFQFIHANQLLEYQFSPYISSIEIQTLLDAFNKIESMDDLDNPYSQEYILKIKEKLLEWL